jgi:Icc-related predicted phosphoesterase
MKILTVSDYVEPKLYQQFDAQTFTHIDLILSCGDLPPEYLAFLAKALNAPLYYVRGNHDIRYGYKTPPGCMDLNGRIDQFKGISFLGLEGSRWYNGGPHQYKERQMRAMVRKLRPKIWWHGKVDVILTHAPPWQIHDAEDECHRGFKVFRWLIEHYTPRYFIHGHIHAQFNDPAERITVVNQTKVVNSYGYWIFEINPA